MLKDVKIFKNTHSHAGEIYYPCIFFKRVFQLSSNLLNTFDFSYSTEMFVRGERLWDYMLIQSGVLMLNTGLSVNVG